MGQLLQITEQQLVRWQQLQHEVQQDVSRLESRMLSQELRLQSLESKLESLASKSHNPSGEAATRDRNRQIASENRNKTRGDDRLKPLLSLINGTVIEAFPILVKDMDILESADVNRILLSLGLHVEGDLEERRRRMRYACGLRYRVFAN